MFSPLVCLFKIFAYQTSQEVFHPLVLLGLLSARKNILQQNFVSVEQPGLVRIQREGLLYCSSCCWNPRPLYLVLGWLCLPAWLVESKEEEDIKQCV